jgi:hypothetical protein
MTRCWLRFAAWAAANVVLTAAAVEMPVGDPLVPSLRGPEVTRLDWNTRGLIVADFDGDGRNDLAVINNDRARIEILFQRAPGEAPALRPRRVATSRWEPEVEDGRFEKFSLTTGITVHDLAAGDLNGNGLIDLVYTGDPDPLTIRYRSPSGDWDEKRVFDFGKPLTWLTSLRIADLNGNGRQDLLVLTQKELLVLRQQPDGQLGVPERYALAEENSYSLKVIDVDGDGRLDVVYLAPNRRDALRVRLQTAAGRFGPEIPFRIEPGRSTLQQVERGAGQTRAFAYVQNQTGMLEVFALVPESPEAGSARALKPRVFSTRTGARIAPAYAFGDFDGDGRLDLALSDAEGAQIFIYRQQPDGALAEASGFPSLSDGRAMAAADWTGDGRAEIFIASPKEQTLGVATFTREGRLSYPQPLPVSGKPVAVAAGPLRAGGPVAVAVAIEENRQRRIDILVRESDGNVVVRSTIQPANLRTDPAALRMVDANQNGRADLVLFVPFEPLRFLVQREDGTFHEISAEPGFRRGLVEGVEPSGFSLADVDGDGRPEMIVSGAGFARALRLDAAGALQVVDQFNARESSNEITAALVADLEGKGQRSIVMLDRKNEQFQLLRRGPAGVFEFVEAVPAGRIELLGAVQLDFNGDGRDDLFFLGRDRFWWLPGTAQDFRVESLFTYESDLREVRYGDVVMGDLNGTGRRDFVMIDPDRNLVEVLARGEGLTARSVLHFRVFEADPHVQRQRAATPEPRETLVADVTGDGREDLILLVHDRILVYPQE